MARPLDPREIEILSKLLSPDLPGGAELRQQVADALVTEIDGNGSLQFAIQPHHAPAAVNRRVVSEGIAPDEDGAGINVILHVLNGRLNELELYRDDLAP